MLYHAYEMTHAAISPMRHAARMGQEVIRNPLNPVADTYGWRAMSAALEMFINATRRYAKPEWEIVATEIDGVAVPVVIEEVWVKPFCKLLHFRREGPVVAGRDDPKVLMVAPMSGHYATLLRGTVAAMLPEHDVYITDWVDARDVPVGYGGFDLDDYTDYLVEFCELLARGGERPTVMAVCQPGIPAMAAAALMAQDGNPSRPASLVLMGSPIDAACNPKQPNRLATRRSLGWFERNVIVHVPWPNRGYTRRVYPGFLQLSGFMSMNIDRHVDAHVRQFENLVKGDGDSAESHRRFYDEYLAVMDLTAEFYLQTIERVFQKRLLARGAYRYRGAQVDPAAIRDIPLLTIEGEKDDITGLGQTEAAHALLPKLAAPDKRHYVARDVGHYGVFNGSRWRKLIQPEVRDFVRAHRQSFAG
jgi:poly(3-hydroxybutyrate) depolymerase